MTSSFILIVDSDPSASHHYDNLLKDCAYQTQIVTSEEDARQQLAKQKIDIVIADLQTLGPAGLPFLAYTRSLRSIPDLIFVTSESTLKIRHRGAEIGSAGISAQALPPGTSLPLDQYLYRSTAFA